MRHGRVGGSTRVEDKHSDAARGTGSRCSFLVRSVQAQRAKLNIHVCVDFDETCRECEEQPGTGQTSTACEPRFSWNRTASPISHGARSVGREHVGEPRWVPLRLEYRKQHVGAASSRTESTARIRLGRPEIEEARRWSREETHGRHVAPRWTADGSYLGVSAHSRSTSIP